MRDPVEFLKELLAIPSVNGRDDEGKTAEFLCGVFRESGLQSEVLRIDGTHANVVARLEGEQSDPPVVWNGHMDTVPYGSVDEWDTDPAVPAERDGYLCARGASDMKSGLAAMVCALCSWKESGKRPPRTILFIGTCDEEKGGLGAETAAAGELLQGAREVLIGEPTGCRMGVAQKGCLWLEISAFGKTSHGAYPQEGCNAVEQTVKLAADIAEFAAGYEHPILGASTAQITRISGGVAPNMTPDACTALMDIRMVPGLTRDMVLARAKELARERSAACGGSFRAEFAVRNDRAALEIQTSHPLARQLAQCIEAHGLAAGLTGINYFTDGSVFARRTPELAVLLFGPGEPGMAHKPNERVELAMYRRSIEILKDMIGLDPEAADENDD